MEFIPMLGVLATLTSTGVQLVGIEICFRIIKKGSTGNFSPAPFIAFFVNSCIWLKYAIMMKILSLIVTNVCGTVLQFIYITVYYFYSTRKTYLCRILLFSCILLVLPFLYANYYEAETTKVSESFGLYGCVFSVLCYASPLATMSEVLRYKSTESMSLALVVANFVAAIEWSFYGMAINNRYVALPSVLGCICGLVQLSLFVAYGCKKRSSRVINA